VCRGEDVAQGAVRHHLERDEASSGDLEG
jgi:hypothetical protein